MKFDVLLRTISEPDPQSLQGSRLTQFFYVRCDGAEALTASGELLTFPSPEAALAWIEHKARSGDSPSIVDQVVSVIHR